MKEFGLILFIFALYHNIQAQTGKPDVCRMEPEKDDGSGADVKTYMYYDQTKDKCFPFRYNGLGGNGNRFLTEKQCMRNCSARASDLYPMDETQACKLPKKKGECLNNYMRYYYSPEHQTCRLFYWSGCVGNGNRFLSFSDCNATCYRAEENPSDKTSAPVDVCSMEPEKDDGSGADVKIYMYYDQTKDNCFPFRYNGLGGNGNRFITEKQCMRNCSARASDLFPMDETRACTLPKKPGECLGNYMRYYYSPEHHTCKSFSWSGCVGNGNRFLSFSACNATCYRAADAGLEDHSDETDVPVGIILGVVLGLIGAIILIVVIVFAVKEKPSSKKHEKKGKAKSEQPLKEERVEMDGGDVQPSSTP